MRSMLRNLLAVSALAALAPVSSARADSCKNHYILQSPELCPWGQAAPLRVARARHTATLLADGSVLVAGGDRGEMRIDPYGEYQPIAIASVERYDPEADRWKEVAPMLRARSSHAATVLSDGRLLVVGGEMDVDQGELGGGSAEIYDPDRDEWSPTTPMNDRLARWGSTATTLHDGRVLVVGGVDLSGVFYARPEIYDPRTDRWSDLPLAPAMARRGYTASLLPNGEVLLVGGYHCCGAMPETLAVIFDPVGMGWRKGAQPEVRRASHQAVSLPDGRVLAMEGTTMVTLWEGRVSSYAWIPVRTPELYDPLTGTWTRGPDSLQPRAGHASVALPGGGVLSIGGTSSRREGNRWVHDQFATVELRTDTQAAPIAIASLGEPRSLHTATVLRDGSVLVVGGRGRNDFLERVEILRVGAKREAR